MNFILGMDWMFKKLNMMIGTSRSTMGGRQNLQSKFGYRAKNMQINNLLRVGCGGCSHELVIPADRMAITQCGIHLSCQIQCINPKCGHWITFSTNWNDALRYKRLGSSWVYVSAPQDTFNDRDEITPAYIEDWTMEAEDHEFLVEILNEEE